MSRLLAILCCLLSLGLSAATLHLCGSSQLDDGHRDVERYPYFSWGTELEKYMPAEHNVRNCALSGHSTKSFRADGHWAKLIAEVKPGDFVGMQFGANDQKYTAGFYREKRFADPNTLFKDILREWVGEIRAKGATPIIISHSGRCTFDKKGKKILDRETAPGINLGSYTKASRELSEELKCDFVDMQTMVRQLSESLGRDEALKNYVISTKYVRGKDGEPSKDTTHPIKSGAEAQAKLFIDDVRRQGLSVAKLFERKDFSLKEGLAAAFAAVNSAGGGRVIVPKGEWKTEKLQLCNRCELHLTEGAVLECSGIEAIGCTNVMISGRGTICLKNGGVMSLTNCLGSRLREFTLKGTTSTPLKIQSSIDTSVRHVSVLANEGVDAISVLGSLDITVEKCHFSCCDEERLRSEARNALVRDLN